MFLPTPKKPDQLHKLWEHPTINVRCRNITGSKDQWSDCNGESITFETQEELPQTVKTDWGGFYSISVTSNKRYDCTCSNELGSLSKVLSASSQQATLNFDFY